MAQSTHMAATTSVANGHQNLTSTPSTNYTSTSTHSAHCGSLMEYLPSASSPEFECHPSPVFYVVVIVLPVTSLLAAAIVGGVCYHKRRQQSRRERTDIHAKESGAQNVERKKNDYTKSQKPVVNQREPEHPDYSLVPETAEVIYANETTIYENTGFGGDLRQPATDAYAQGTSEVAAGLDELGQDLVTDDPEIRDLPIAPSLPKATGSSTAVGKPKASRAQPARVAEKGSHSSSGRGSADGGRRQKRQQAELEPSPEEPVYQNFTGQKLSLR